MEALVTHINLKTAIFDHFKTKLWWLCEKDEEIVPTVMIVFDKWNGNKNPKMVELFLGLIASPMLRDTIVTDSDSLEINHNFLSCVDGCDSADHCAFCSVIGSSDIVGLAFCSEEGNVIGVTKFEASIPQNDIEHLIFEQFNFHVVLVSNLEFTHTVLGLQSCSSSNPCCLCLVKLDELRKARSTAEGEPPNRAQFNTHLTEVKKELH